MKIRHHRTCFLAEMCNVPRFGPTGPARTVGLGGAGPVPQRFPPRLGRGVAGVGPSARSARVWRAGRRAVPAAAMSRQSTLLRFFSKATPPPAGSEPRSEPRIELRSEPRIELRRCRASGERNGLQAAGSPPGRASRAVARRGENGENGEKGAGGSAAVKAPRYRRGRGGRGARPAGGEGGRGRRDGDAAAGGGSGTLGLSASSSPRRCRSPRRFLAAVPGRARGAGPQRPLLPAGLGGRDTGTRPGTGACSRVCCLQIALHRVLDLLSVLYRRMTRWVRLEGTTVAHLAQPPCSSRVTPEHTAQDCIDSFECL